jgi:hypothetical protein
MRLLAVAHVVRVLNGDRARILDWRLRVIAGALGKLFVLHGSPRKVCPAHQARAGRPVEQQLAPILGKGHRFNSVLGWQSIKLI